MHEKRFEAGDFFYLTFCAFGRTTYKNEECNRVGAYGVELILTENKNWETLS